MTLHSTLAGIAFVGIFSCSLLSALMMTRIVETPESVETFITQYIIQMPKWLSRRLLVAAIAVMVFVKYREHSNNGKPIKRQPDQVNIANIIKFISFALLLSLSVFTNGYVVATLALALPSLALGYYVVTENRARQQYFERLKRR